MSTKWFPIIALVLSLTAKMLADTHIPAGDVFGTWFSSGSPYLIEGEITIPADSTLNIQSGVDVIFQGHFKFIVHGYLEAIGTESDSILFTAADSIEGWGGIRFINAPDSSHLSFCTIQYGNAWESLPDPDSYGGGIYCGASNPAFTHCFIRWNQAEIGGGLYCSFSNPIIDHCTISDNTAGWIGGINCENSNPTIIDCTVRGNFPIGLYFGHESNAIIDRCIITENRGFGIQCYLSSPIIDSCIISHNWEFVGGGVHCDSLSDPTIIYCTITGNTGGSGDANGGIVCRHNSNPLISHCTIADNSGSPAAGGVNSLSGSRPTLNHCLITGNSGSAGAIVCWSNSGANIDHCTISGNTGFVSAWGTGGICCYYDSGTVISNTIVEGNSGNGGIRFQGSVNPSVQFCDVYNNQNGNLVGELPPGLGELVTLNANGDSCDTFFNIYLDPLFLSLSTGDYHLQSNSPCIDAGDPTSPHDPDGTIADMGAFYYPHSGVPNRPPNAISPTMFHLFQNYPNPFNLTTNIPFEVPTTKHVVLTIYDVLGRQVGILVDDVLSPGFYRVPFDATALSSGMYFYQMSVNNFTTMKKMTFLK